MRPALVILFSLIITAAGLSATIYVPDDYSTIQGAIDAAVEDDLIIVRAGTYTENINFSGKVITVESESGPSSTTISGVAPSDPDYGSVVLFENGASAGGGVYFEYDNPDLESNSIVNNRADTYGGGVFCKEGAPGAQVEQCVISSNTAGYGGGGIWTTASDATLVISNVVQNNDVLNSGAWGGGGICVFISNTTLVNNLVSGNHSPAGGGLSISFGSYPVVTNNTVTQNSADEGGGLYCYDSGPIIYNTIFWHNTAASSPEIYKYGTNPTIDYCDIEGGWSSGGNNIDLDPLFIDPAADDFHLTLQSPCGNAGDATALSLPDKDIEGDPRAAWNGVDIGADEFYFHLYHLGDVVPGDTIAVRVVGLPNMAANVLKGSGLRYPPMNTQFGKFYLTTPIRFIFLGRIPANGILEHTATIPLTWQSGEKRYFQGLVGGTIWPSSRLTNPRILTVQ